MKVACFDLANDEARNKFMSELQWVNNMANTPMIMMQNAQISNTKSNTLTKPPTNASQEATKSSKQE